MTMKNMSLLSGATVSATGGTALVLTGNGISIPNGVQMVVAADTDYSLRRSVTARVRNPSLNKDGVWSKDKKVISYTVPIRLATGQIVHNVIRVERELHPEAASTVGPELNKLGAQLLVDSDADNFWLVGSTD